jgi:hypothetical protein
MAARRDVETRQRTMKEATMAEVQPASETAIRLDSCRQFETIRVNTSGSVYELIVLNGDSGDVIVRGGRTFPEFSRAVFAGSKAGRCALKKNTIEVGLPMDFHVGRTIVITSGVKAISRQRRVADRSHDRDSSRRARSEPPSPAPVRLDAETDDPLRVRIRAEFGELPGLKITLDQACRLFNAGHVQCERTLAELVRNGELSSDCNVFFRADAH